MMFKILKYQLRDVLRSKWVLVYALFFWALTDVLFRFGGDPVRVAGSMMNIVLVVIPLASGILGAFYLYNTREFIELLLCHPVERKQLFGGLIIGLGLPMILAFTLGVLFPFLYHGMYAEAWPTLASLLFSGAMLTAIFLAISFFIALSFDDRIKGFGLTLLFCLVCTIIYDGLILFIIYTFSNYPLEKPVLVLILFNPVDLARVLMLLQLDISALMGLTGAVYREFFGEVKGGSLAALSLGIWLVLPSVAGYRCFLRKDF